MATASVSGLSSGLDTAGIIDQLMQLESVPQTRLKNTLTTEQARISSLQAINTKVAALLTQARDLASPTAWTALTATSSSTAVAVATTGGTTQGTFSFTVDQTAAAHRLTFASTANGADVVVSAGTTVSLTVGGTTMTLETGDGTLDGLVTALNASGTGVNATKLRLDDGSHRLVVTASQTGAASGFTLTSGDGSDLLGGAAVTAGRDAAITVGSDTIHSASNTFSGVIPGLDVTVSTAAVGSTVEVSVARDDTKVRDAVKSLVDNVNAVLTQIDTLTAYDSTAKGALPGDALLRDLRSDLLSAVYPADGGTMAGLGLQTDRYGKLVLDQDKLAQAFAADPTAVAAAFTKGSTPATDGWAARVQAVAKTASDVVDGSITTAITGRTATIDRLTDSIEAWDLRLELRRTTLTRQFTALETALSNLQSQSSWLAGQLGTLNSSSSSS
jgi:flagellar hook-associated protein 2